MEISNNLNVIWAFHKCAWKFPRKIDCENICKLLRGVPRIGGISKQQLEISKYRVILK
jgi:hypothetical protein